MPRKQAKKRTKQPKKNKPVRKVLTGAANCGQRRYQEDRHLMISAEEGLILAVMDGHGDAACSQLLEQKFCEVWDSVYSPEKSPDFLFKELFDKFDMLTSYMDCGSTMSVVFIPKANTGKEKVAHVAVLGDSPVLIQQPDGTWHIGPEHNVRTNMIERQAAIQRGGYYSSNGYICYGPEGHGLQMSRAFGDCDLGKILCRQPEVYSVELGDWALVGSDGLLSPGHDETYLAMIQEIVKLIEEKDANAEDLVNYAAAVPTGDNVTAILWRRS